jgi:hypothetical protein
MPADFTTPLTSDKPALLFSGGMDPVTPPRYAAEVAKTLTRSRQIVAKGYGHIVSPAACGPRLIATFVEDADFARLSASCVKYFENSLPPPLWPDRLGQITGLLGPNGAGKTTLLRMLGTLIVPDTGSASIGGLDVVRERFAVRERLGVLSDARGLYPRLTARENIRYYGALHGLTGRDLDARIAALLHTLGLDALADRRTQGFSQGEKMKVAIARALSTIRRRSCSTSPRTASTS